MIHIMQINEIRLLYSIIFFTQSMHESVADSKLKCEACLLGIVPSTNWVFKFRILMSPPPLPEIQGKASPNLSSYIPPLLSVEFINQLNTFLILSVTMR